MPDAVPFFKSARKLFTRPAPAPGELLADEIVSDIRLSLPRLERAGMSEREIRHILRNDVMRKLERIRPSEG